MFPGQVAMSDRKSEIDCLVEPLREGDISVYCLASLRVLRRLCSGLVE